MLPYLLAILVAQGPAACSAADPSIVSARVQSVTRGGEANVYHLTGTVVNTGHTKQQSNVLQFVDVILDGTKVEARGVPPLAPGQQYSFGYDLRRSAEAGHRTSNVRFQMEFRQPALPGSQDCNLDNDAFDLRV